MKKGIIIWSIIALVGCSQQANNQTKVANDTVMLQNGSETNSFFHFEEDSIRLSEKATEALVFCKKNNYNTDFCILIDMKIHSGKYRMFVWNFNDQEIERKALCAHGCGKENNKSTGEQPVFSNTPESLLTSLGKYKTGIRSYSRYGIHAHYKMHGLEQTNNNAFKRQIVLHSHNPVPANEIYPTHLPMGWSFGCPVTDNATMTYLDEKLKVSKKPVLIWIFR